MLMFALKLFQILGMVKKSSTSKSNLLKLNNPLTDTILQYRKLSAILNNTVRPMLLAIENER